MVHGRLCLTSQTGFDRSKWHVLDSLATYLPTSTPVRYARRCHALDPNSDGPCLAADHSPNAVASSSPISGVSRFIVRQSLFCFSFVRRFRIFINGYLFSVPTAPAQWGFRSDLVTPVVYVINFCRCLMNYKNKGSGGASLRSRTAIENYDGFNLTADEFWQTFTSLLFLLNIILTIIIINWKKRTILLFLQFCY